MLGQRCAVLTPAYLQLCDFRSLLRGPCLSQLLIGSRCLCSSSLKLQLQLNLLLLMLLYMLRHFACFKLLPLYLSF